MSGIKSVTEDSSSCNSQLRPTSRTDSGRGLVFHRKITRMSEHTYEVQCLRP